MESFALSAQHSGAINHLHTIHLDASVVQTAREFRLAVTAVVAGWIAVTGIRALFAGKGGGPGREGQGEISRSRHGVRVSRCLTARESRRTTSSDHRISLTRNPQDIDQPYWGTLRSSQVPRARAGPTAHPVKASPLHNGYAHVKPPGSKRHKSPLTEKPLPDLPHVKDSMGPAARNYEQQSAKRYGVADPVAWDAINRSLMQQRQLSSLLIPDDLANESLRHSDIPSRSSSQRRTLDRFTRQLEKYAEAAKATGGAPIATPTVSESRASLHTVKPLMPYRNEFQSAGLAVTSKEQTHKPLAKGNRIGTTLQRHVHGDIPESTKVLLQLTRDSDGQDDSLIKSACSSTSSYVEFTPPDGYKTHLMEGLPIHKPEPKPKPIEKIRLLPWLKKRPVDDSHHHHNRVIERRSQPAHDSRLRTIPPSSRTSNSGLPRGTQAHSHGAGVNRGAQNHKPTLPPKIAAVPPTLVTSKRAACVAMSSTDYGQDARVSHPNPWAVQHGGDQLAIMPQISKALREKRDLSKTRRPVPQPETIDEATEPSPSPLRSQATKEKAKAENRIMAELEKRQDSVSPQTDASSVPSLPYTARFAASKPASLDRALSVVSQQLDEVSKQADERACTSGHVSILRESTNQGNEQVPELVSGRRESNREPSYPLRKKGKYIDAATTMSPPGMKPSAPRPLPPAQPALPPPPKPTRAAPLAPVKLPEMVPVDQHAKPRVPIADDRMNDLDVFVEYDDGDIDDRDVIKGLQVAIHAAADDGYDAHVRNKTGLRIRRFLADLKSFEEVQREISGYQHERERRAEIRRLQRIQDRKVVPRSGS
ncbi:hypothetical protein F4778DRAFT_791068 [Xylariomycetidae sp. FL2044]|nr:hypothetical protein F4778DRAFT_791068 [Xylariomycetidae sp. FL2044]